MSETTRPDPAPALFISHGAPTLAGETGGFAAELARWGAALGRPRAAVVVSAHWVANEPRTGVERTAELMYDFGGFPDELYRIRYAPPGSPELAARVRELTGAVSEETRPWDHGVWVPLMKMYPRADVPVVQVALPLRAGPAAWIELGRALAPLRREGVAVIGSGGAVHNLRRLAWHGGGAVEPWARTFDGWVADVVGRRDLAALGRVLDEAPSLREAHPTVEHLAPLLVAAGAAAVGDELPAATFPITGWVMGSLSMRSIQWA
ncbi:MAG TPA: class III extradiol ring-cleavage dioxygenase [Kofleriaceae bacterium]|nr:class III extradiol ring-cleavage dioxygenase [Kofleriaceae bacterium]